MKALRCDRCGNYYEFKEGDVLTYIDKVDVTVGPTKSKSTQTKEKYDLCDNCAESFVNWFEDYLPETNP